MDRPFGVPIVESHPVGGIDYLVEKFIVDGEVDIFDYIMLPLLQKKQILSTVSSAAIANPQILDNSNVQQLVVGLFGYSARVSELTDAVVGHCVSLLSLFPPEMGLFLAVVNEIVDFKGMEHDDFVDCTSVLFRHLLHCPDGEIKNNFLRVLDTSFADKFGVPRGEYGYATTWCMNLMPSSRKEDGLVNALARNVVCMRELEHLQPGSVKLIHANFGIVHFGRYSALGLLAQLSVESLTEQTPVLTAYRCGNGSFDFMNSRSSTLCGPNQNPLYFEYSNETSFLSHLWWMYKRKPPYVVLPHIAINGHGDSRGISASNPPSFLTFSDLHPEYSIVDEKGETQIIPHELFVELLFNTHVLMGSCEQGHYFAASFSRVFGVNVFASPDISYVKKFHHFRTKGLREVIIPEYVGFSRRQTFNNAEKNPVPLGFAQLSANGSPLYAIDEKLIHSDTIMFVDGKIDEVFRFSNDKLVLPKMRTKTPPESNL